MQDLIFKPMEFSGTKSETNLKLDAKSHIHLDVLSFMHAKQTNAQSVVSESSPKKKNPFGLNKFSSKSRVSDIFCRTEQSQDSDSTRNDTIQSPPDSKYNSNPFSFGKKKAPEKNLSESLLHLKLKAAPASPTPENHSPLNFNYFSTESQKKKASEPPKPLRLQKTICMKYGVSTNMLSSQDLAQLVQDSLPLVDDQLATVRKSAELPNENILLFDCRFDYEFQGGHINGAISMNEPPEFAHTLLSTGNDKIFFSQNAINEIKKDQKLNMENLEKLVKIADADPVVLQQDPILVFYCEFSSSRAPRLYQYWRELDRFVNAYPALKFPNFYILQGGYSAFVEKYPTGCSTNGGYIKMTDKKYQQELSIGFAQRKNVRSFAFSKSSTGNSSTGKSPSNSSQRAEMSPMFKGSSFNIFKVMGNGSK